MIWLKLGVLLAIVGLFACVLYYARKEARKTEQVANLRREIERQAKEQERANAIIDNVRNMSDSNVRDRLSDISGKQR